jgi:hypothetical protein
MSTFILFCSRPAYKKTPLVALRTARNEVLNHGHFVLPPMAEDAVGSETASENGGASTGDKTAGDERAPPADSTGDASTDDAYGGVLGAFPYALRSSDSWFFRSYVVVGGLAALALSVLFALSVVVLLGNTVGAGGGRFSFSRAFFIFVGLCVVAPLLAPVLFVARHTRRGRADSRYDFTFAGLGYLFLVALYVGGIISTPAVQQELPAGGLARSVVAALYSLPRLAGLVPPLLVALAMGVLALRWR